MRKGPVDRFAELQPDIELVAADLGTNVHALPAGNAQVLPHVAGVPPHLHPEATWLTLAADDFRVRYDLD